MPKISFLRWPLAAPLISRAAILNRQPLNLTAAVMVASSRRRESHKVRLTVNVATTQTAPHFYQDKIMPQVQTQTAAQTLGYKARLIGLSRTVT